MVINKDYLSFKLLVFVLVLFSASCQDDISSESKSIPNNDANKLKGSNKVLSIPKGYRYDVLFREGQNCLNVQGDVFASKGDHDCIVYIPIHNSSKHGYLFVGHESKGAHNGAQHGGGATIFEVKLENNKWRTLGTPQEVDYSSVGGTLNNCGGKLTPKGTILTAEEIIRKTNKDLFKVFPDTTDFEGQPRYKNFGWIVEVDPHTKKAIKKLYAMGRFSHEDAYPMPDRKTVYLSNDGDPAILYKFVADSVNDYSKGQLFAYSESAQGNWIVLPRDYESLSNINAVSIKMGATMFIRHEWLTKIGNKLLITETGKDKVCWSKHIQNGGVPTSYLSKRMKEDSCINDPYGRVLALDLKTGELSTFIQSDPKDSSDVFIANPDGLTSYINNEDTVVYICEDVIGLDKGRVSVKHKELDLGQSELFKHSGYVGSRKYLKRMAQGPYGAELTGPCLTPDGKTLFLSVQHPSNINKKPFDKSCVVAIRKK